MAAPLAASMPRRRREGRSNDPHDEGSEADQVAAVGSARATTSTAERLAWQARRIAGIEEALAVVDPLLAGWAMLRTLPRP